MLKLAKAHSSEISQSFPPPAVSRKTYNHLTILRNLDPLALHNLHIVQPTQNLVLHLERGGHGELGALLDFEGLVLERGLGAGRRQFDGHGRAAG